MCMVELSDRLFHNCLTKLIVTIVDSDLIFGGRNKTF